MHDRMLKLVIMILEDKNQPGSCWSELKSCRPKGLKVKQTSFYNCCTIKDSVIQVLFPLDFPHLSVLQCTQNMVGYKSRKNSYCMYHTWAVAYSHNTLDGIIVWLLKFMTNFSIPMVWRANGRDWSPLQPQLKWYFPHSGCLPQSSSPHLHHYTR